MFVPLHNLIFSQKKVSASNGGWRVSRNEPLPKHLLANGTWYLGPWFLAICSCFLFATAVQAAAIRNLVGLNTNTLAANDDGSTGAVNMGFTINFYGVVKNTCYVNNNGNITFNSSLGAFTPMGLATTVSQPIIAPFFADVDTRGSGSSLVKYGTDTLCGRKVFGVNWINVGYFSSAFDKLNSFQLLLIDRSDTGANNFDIEMNYDKIQWETGAASGGSGGLGGTSVEAGYTNGASGAARVSYEFTGSRVNGAMLDGGPNALVSNVLNSKVSGRYYFPVRSGQVVGPTVPKTSQKGQDITGMIRAFFPLRYLYNPKTGLYSGTFNLVRPKATTRKTTTTTTSLTSSQQIDNCLGVVTTSSPKSTPQPAAVNGPVTIIFLQMPRGVSLANAAGTTTKGRPYVYLAKATLGAGQGVSCNIVLRNPSRVSLTSYRQGRGWNFQVVIGPFDPTKN